MKMFRIKPHDANVGPTQQPVRNEDVNAGGKQDETEVTDSTSIQTSASCAQSTSNTEAKVSEATNYSTVWKTFALVLDRVFLLVHFLFQSVLILAVLFKL